MNNDDGAAMRIAPIGIFNAGEPEKAAEMAEIEAEISHYEDGIWAAQAVAASIAVAMVNGTTEEIIDAGRQFIPEDSWLGRNMARMQAIWEIDSEIETCWEQLHSDFWTPAHSVAPEAIPQTYAIIHYTKADFTKGLFWSANFGRDADTITAIVGAVSGARYGVKVIPDEWKEQVRKPAGVCLHFTRDEDIVRLAEQLADLMLT
jgi:ADP-ribosylglycohydrolase